MNREASAPLKKSTVVLCLTLIAAYAFLVRCLHLLNPDHYYIISADSYFFHWMAELVQSGERVDYPFLGHTVPTIWHTGITYPLAYIAKAVSFVFGMSPVDALTFTSKFLPPTLSVISIIVMYLAVSRMYDQRVGLFSAFAWATFFHTWWVQAAGYLDRDGVSMLLFMTGAFIFYLSREWHWKIGSLDLGWVAGGVSVLGIEALLLVEWIWVGPLLLLAILATFFAAEVLGRFSQRIAPSLMDLIEMNNLPSVGRKWLTSIILAVKESNWRVFSLILGLSALAGGISPGFPYMYRLTTGIVKEVLSPPEGGFVVQEMQGLGLGDLIGYGFFVIPIVIGLCIILINHRRADLFCLSWFACLLLLGLFSRRVFLYAAPASCIISGLGLAFVCDFRKLRRFLRFMEESARHYVTYMQMCAATLLLLFLLLSSLWWSLLAPMHRMAASNNWQDALFYLRDNTSEKAVVMSWWDYGYWILDVAERRPVVDNGFYAYDSERLEDVGLAYCTTEASEAVQAMQRCGADYLVFSEVEIVILPVITWFGLGEEYGDGRSIPEELKDSLYSRSLSGDFQSEQGLEVVYRNEEVVILGLE